MELTAHVDTSAQYHIAYPLFCNEKVVGVLDGRYVRGTVPRKAIKAVRLESRSSFKHPIVGSVVGLVMAGVPVQAVLGDPLGLWWAVLASPYRLVGSFFMFWIGVYLLWSVARRRKEPWIVFVLDTMEQAYPLDPLSSSTPILSLLELCGVPVLCPFCLKCGYDLRASKFYCPECGATIPTK